MKRNKDRGWIKTRSQPVGQVDLPTERRLVLLQVEHDSSFYLGHIRYAAGDSLCPFWVISHAMGEMVPKVLAFRDCLPNEIADRNVKERDLTG